MITCALKGTPESISGSMHGARRELTIDFICFLCVLTSLGPVDRKPLFFTISDVKNNISEHACAITNLNKQNSKPNA